MVDFSMKVSGAKVTGMNGHIVLDPDNAFEWAVARMVETHRRKSKDYAGEGEDVDPYQNFVDSAYQLSLTPGESVENLIATKQARLRVLLPKFYQNPETDPANEPIADTLLDRAVYAVIGLVLWQEGQYHPNSVPTLERS